MENDTYNEEHFTKVVEEFVSQKKFLSSLETKVDKLKKELSTLVDKFGTPDENGHRWLNVGGHELKRERRVSKSFSTETATEWAKANGYWDDVKETIPAHDVLNEDKLLGIAWNDKSLTAAVQSFYVEKESWAFKA